MCEEVIDVCDCCCGDGGWSYPRMPFGGDPNVIDWAWDWCKHCDGEGFVWRAVEPAGEEWITEALLDGLQLSVVERHPCASSL